MDIIHTARPAPFGAVIRTIFSNLADGISAPVIASFNANRTRKALRSLSERQLDDIGLTRGDIVAVSRKSTLMR